jgi:hypothetical protein
MQVDKILKIKFVIETNVSMWFHELTRRHVF